jgi:predicted O-methyltransferase YrrM
MSNQNPMQELWFTYRGFVSDCRPETVTASRVLGLLEKARSYLSTLDGMAGHPDVVRARVYLRNAAKTLLMRANWIGAAAQESLVSFINEQPEFLPDEPYRFTQDYFTDNIVQWSKDHGRFVGLSDLHFLEIGSFEGRSACWLLQNVLTHDSSRITCIDLFAEERSQGAYDTTGLDSNLMSTEDRFDYNIRQMGASHRVEKLKGNSHELLRSLPRSQYDFIYIDGSHVAKDVLEDAVLAWPLLKTGGMLTFDDYEWRDEPDPLRCPGIGIDAFLRVYEGHYRMIHKAYQVTLESC